MILFLTVLAIAPAHAQDNRALSYEEALRDALAHNPSLVGAGYDVDAAEGALMSARGVFDPAFSASTTQNQFTSESVREFGEVLSEFESRAWGVGLNQLLPTGTTLGVDWSTTATRFKYELRDTGYVVDQQDPLFESRMVATLSQNLLEGHRLASNLEGVRAAARGQDIALANQRMVRQQTLADTASAYWNTRTQRKLAEIAAAAVETALEEQRVVHAKVDQGTLAPVERARVDTAVIQARRESLLAQDTARNTEDSLLLLIGESSGAVLTLTSSPTEPTALSIDAAAVEQAALDGNAELKVKRIQEHSAEMARLDARHKLLPELNVNASYGMIGYEPSASRATDELMSGDLPEWTLGAQFSMPLLGRADRGQALQRAAEASKVRAEKLQLERQIRTQVRAQIRTIEAAAMQVSLTAANLDLATQTLTAERALVEAGRVIQKDLLESIAAVDDARIQVEQSKGDYQMALIELDRLKGTL